MKKMPKCDKSAESERVPWKRVLRNPIFAAH